MVIYGYIVALCRKFVANLRHKKQTFSQETVY